MPSGPGVIWDMDGTLVDTAEMHFQAWAELCRELGRSFSRADFSVTFGWRNPEIIPQLFGHRFSPDEIAVLGDRKEQIYRAAARRGVEPLPGVRVLLDALRSAGAGQAIGSSAPRANLELILEVAGLGGYFAAVVAMEDTSRGKPDPEVFLLAAMKLGVAARHCVVLEDAPVGVRAAKSAGMRCVGVTVAGHHSSSDLQAAGADLVLHSLDQIEACQLLELVAKPSVLDHKCARSGVGEFWHA